MLKEKLFDLLAHAANFGVVARSPGVGEGKCNAVVAVFFAVVVAVQVVETWHLDKDHVVQCLESEDKRVAQVVPVKTYVSTNSSLQMYFKPIQNFIERYM